VHLLETENKLCTVKTHLGTKLNSSSALEVIFNVMCSINPRFTYLLTYHGSACVDKDAKPKYA